MKAKAVAAVVLQFFPTTEGYVNVDLGVYKYVFNYLDHLGNVRLSYTKNEVTGLTVIMEENHYYPSGLKHTNYNTTVMKLRGSAVQVSSTNPYKYKYNGCEYQEELGLNLYDMEMRDYDPAIGRWINIDPITHHDQSPFMAFNGNPVFFADPSGADGIGINTWHYAGSGVNGGMSSFSNGDHMFGNSGDDFWMGNGASTGAGFSAISLSGNNLTINWAAFGDGRTVWNATNNTLKRWVPRVGGTIRDGNPDVNRLDTTIVNGYWETLNNTLGYASFAGEAVNHNWAGATFKYGQRLADGSIMSAQALTDANRVSSLLWGARFAKVGLVTNVIGTSISYNNIINDVSKGRGVNGWDIADAGVGTIATASSAASVAITAGVFEAASLGAAAFLVSNPVGWGIAIGATAYFTYRLLSD